jgi:hypothetical protein
MVAVISIATVHLSPERTKREHMLPIVKPRTGRLVGRMEPGAILCKALVDLPWAGSSI